ncbi:autophagy-related protein 27 [Entophlyctis helioformis]|nr:autophagy-related protein 27 [Entophlyctis helioformis]
MLHAHQPSANMSLSVLLLLLLAGGGRQGLDLGMGVGVAHAQLASCSQLSVQSAVFNVTQLFGEPFFNVTLASLPHAPTVDTVVLVGNPCKKLTVDDSKPREDQCADDALLCEITTNWKHAEGRVTSIRTLASTATVPVVAAIDQGISITTTMQDRPAVALNIRCKKDALAASNPAKIVAQANQITIEWEHAAGCPLSLPSGSVGSGSSMSTVGSFFTILFVGFFAYFVVGMAYNYTVLKISSFPDIIPHHELWIGVAAGLVDIGRTLWQRVSGSSNSSYVQL